MTRFTVLLAASAAVAGSLLATPSHAACAAPIVNSPPSGAFATCASAATAYSLAVTSGGVYWFVGCNGAVVGPTTLTWAPGGAWGAIPGGCANATITLRAAVPGTNAVGQLT